MLRTRRALLSQARCGESQVVLLRGTGEGSLVPQGTTQCGGCRVTAPEPVLGSGVLMGLGASSLCLLPLGLFTPLPWPLWEPPLEVLVAGESHRPISALLGGSQGNPPGRGARKARAAPCPGPQHPASFLIPVPLPPQPSLCGEVHDSLRSPLFPRLHPFTSSLRP